RLRPHGGDRYRSGARLERVVDRVQPVLDPPYAHAVQKVFVDLYDKGLIYRDNRMVNWDPGSRSAISDLEVEDREVTDTLYYIDYPLESGRGSVTIATVRPETMLADTALAVHPDDDRYTRLIGETAILPLVGRRLKIIADPYVKPEFGTGALKITPGHDPNDFEIGRTHGLDEVTVIGEDGLMTEAAGERFAGLKVLDARDAVVAALEAEGAIAGTEPYEHDVPHSHRSGMRIEPLISLQWFCDMEKLAEPAIRVVKEGRVRFHPENPWAGVYLSWMENIRPWCVSRQLWWGHQIPVWYCDECGEMIAAEEEPEQCPCGKGSPRRDPDVLDTWFSSALWPFATLRWPADTPELRAFYPTDVLVTARDIIFLWVARMIMMGIEFTGEIPFTDVPITSVIQAPDGRRMSKSLGTGIDPLDEIDEYGADAVRFGLIAMASTQDVRYSEKRVKQGQDLANKLWNASRLVLLKVDPDVEPAPRPETAEDRWILSRLERATERIGGRYESFELSRAALDLYDFFWGEVCDWYLELVKPRLYDEQADRTALSATLLHVLERVLKLAHPLIPFVTEEIWSFLPGERGLLAASPWPKVDPERFDEAAEGQVGSVIEAITALRRYRDEVGAPAGARIPGRILAAGYEGALDHVARLARFELEPGSDENGDVVATVAIPRGSVQVLRSDAIDTGEAERRREAEVKRLQSEIARAEGKLANSGFVSKAPEHVVEAERQKLARLKAELEELS
ncbi:MAG TPA: valine--tRNA ligase, partial [Thermoleophilaceae bacterium]